MANLGEMFGAGAGLWAIFMGVARADLGALAADVVIQGADGSTPYASVGQYCAGGPALDLIEGVAAKARIAGLALVEFMPAQDVGGMGAMTAAQLLAAAVGVIVRQV